MDRYIDELAIVKPTIFGSVPRVMNRLYDKLQAAMSESKVKNFLLSKATASKRSRLDAGQVRVNYNYFSFMLKTVWGAENKKFPKKFLPHFLNQYESRNQSAARSIRRYLKNSRISVSTKSDISV